LSSNQLDGGGVYDVGAPTKPSNQSFGMIDLPKPRGKMMKMIHDAPE